MSGHLVIAALKEAWEKFGGFPADKQDEIARWVQRRVNGVKGDAVWCEAEARQREVGELKSLYDREPGEEG